MIRHNLTVKLLGFFFIKSFNYYFTEELRTLHMQVIIADNKCFSFFNLNIRCIEFNHLCCLSTIGRLKEIVLWGL